MAPIMFGALAPLQFTLESANLRVYLSHAGQPLPPLATGVHSSMREGAVNSTAIGEGAVEEEAAAAVVAPSIHALWAALVTSALLALALNIAEMILVEATSALTLNIANTAKFAAIILLSVVLFGTILSPLRLLGIALCIMGVGLFNLHKAKIAKAKAAAGGGASGGGGDEEQAELELQPLLKLDGDAVDPLDPFAGGSLAAKRGGGGGGAGSSGVVREGATASALATGVAAAAAEETDPSLLSSASATAAAAAAVMMGHAGSRPDQKTTRMNASR
jgi:multidrug transporter EmrE-like cation transporter